jgi:hypothetical protein
MASRKRKKYKLKEIIPLLSEDTLKVASGMIDDAIFLEKQLEDLRARITKEGISEDYQYGSKQTAAVTTYLQMQKQYGVIIKYLTDQIPNAKNQMPANMNLLDWVEAN